MNTYTKQQWIAEQAREHPERVFTSLHHLIDGEWMREAYRRTRKEGATGIDGVTAGDYEKDLEANLDDLLSRIKSGRYFAPPVRRHYIPKADGTKRPLGIPTFEDKVAQRAILMMLEPIYETDFLPCSYGFRPGRFGSRCPERSTYGHHRAAPTVGDRRGFESVLRLDTAHPPAVIPRPAD